MEGSLDPDDESGFGSVRQLVDLFRDKANALAGLRLHHRTIISWAGHSDSSQGGFVIPADLLAELGALGCDLFGTVYNRDPE